MKNKIPQQRFNAKGVCVEEYIKEGRTSFFLERNDAIEYKNNKRSYHEECYWRDEEGVFTFAGWTVPN